MEPSAAAASDDPSGTGGGSTGNMPLASIAPGAYDGHVLSLTPFR